MMWAIGMIGCMLLMLWVVSIVALWVPTGLDRSLFIPASQWCYELDPEAIDNSVCESAVRNSTSTVWLGLIVSMAIIIGGFIGEWFERRPSNIVPPGTNAGDDDSTPGGGALGNL